MYRNKAPIFQFRIPDINVYREAVAQAAAGKGKAEVIEQLQMVEFLDSIQQEYGHISVVYVMPHGDWITNLTYVDNLFIVLPLREQRYFEVLK